MIAVKRGKKLLWGGQQIRGTLSQTLERSRGSEKKSESEWLKRIIRKSDQGDGGGDSKQDWTLDTDADGKERGKGPGRTAVNRLHGGCATARTGKKLMPDCQWGSQEAVLGLGTTAKKEQKKASRGPKSAKKSQWRKKKELKGADVSRRDPLRGEGMAGVPHGMGVLGHPQGTGRWLYKPLENEGEKT